MSRFELTYKPFGERSILIEWPAQINENILNDVLSFKNRLKQFYIKQKVYIKSAYNSILVIYEYTINNIYDTISHLKLLYSQENVITKSTYRQWKIPVCYDDEFSVDLEELSSNLELTKEDIIDIHTSNNYQVYFIGFLPGFLYLGGLDERLFFARKETPRLAVPKGAVAIGGKQTGVYPNESPGGWNIIGNSPIEFFNIHKQIPCFAKAGDRIKFYNVSKEEYLDIKKLQEIGTYQLESEVIND